MKILKSGGNFFASTGLHIYYALMLCVMTCIAVSTVFTILVVN